MQDKENFLAMLAAIVDLAKTQDNIITTDEIKELLDDSEFTEEQMGHVYEYLAANQIRIQGYIRATKTMEEQVENLADSEQEYVDSESKKAIEELNEREQRLEQEEASYIRMYLEDLEAISPMIEGEIEGLLQSLRKGNRSAKERLLELHLREVVTIARSYQGRGIIVGDLIQEGNIGLMTALEEIYTGANRVPTESVSDTTEYILNRIRESMEFVIAEQQDDKILENRIVEKVNFISATMKELAEEYGREATIEELVQFTKIDKSEMEDILELAKDTLSVSEEE
ncbi:sigma factor [Anaerosporobacter sp.]|uniref:sigma factor n=1 Tax=Anaerosporobacter sp. TaxID=1872529 RepID=UPI00286F80A9|nr:sigma factor [Anaerosporobacter sp.]